MLGGAQKEQASGKLDALSREAGRLTKEESVQAERLRTLAGQQGADDESTLAQIASGA